MFSSLLLCKEQANGLRYWACGRDADALDGQKNVRDVENAPKAAPYPQVQCTLHALLATVFVKKLFGF